ncbi:uncharacterized protein LOC135812787 [Sycon ciliatum]|uniref:uncharacterized protein LOC135812787 n=1 Tax=Sycon ciliatum TaxID=27933 RepID=UPI0031F6CA93
MPEFGESGSNSLEVSMIAALLGVGGLAVAGTFIVLRRQKVAKPIEPGASAGDNQSGSNRTLARAATTEISMPSDIYMNRDSALRPSRDVDSHTQGMENMAYSKETEMLPSQKTSSCTDHHQKSLPETCISGAGYLFEDDDDIYNDIIEENRVKNRPQAEAPPVNRARGDDRITSRGNGSSSYVIAKPGFGNEGAQESGFASYEDPKAGCVGQDAGIASRRNNADVHQAGTVSTASSCASRRISMDTDMYGNSSTVRAYCTDTRPGIGDYLAPGEALSKVKTSTSQPNINSSPRDACNQGSRMPNEIGQQFPMKESTFTGANSQPPPATRKTKTPPQLPGEPKSTPRQPHKDIYSEPAGGNKLRNT